MAPRKRTAENASDDDTIEKDADKVPFDAATDAENDGDKDVAHQKSLPENEEPDLAAMTDEERMAFEEEQKKLSAEHRKRTADEQREIAAEREERAKAEDEWRNTAREEVASDDRLARVLYDRGVLSYDDIAYING